MPTDAFQIAARRAEAAYKPALWRQLSPTEKCIVIYQQLRKLDAESVAASKSERLTVQQALAAD